jgi:hypothetical protein
MDKKTEIIELPSYKNNPTLYAVNSRSDNQDKEYFPEMYLCQYLEKNKIDPNPIVYTFKRDTGVIGMTEGYEIIIKRHDIDLLILVDGGNDSLMKGDESGLGSPHEDSKFGFGYFNFV